LVARPQTNSLANSLVVQANTPPPIVRSNPPPPVHPNVVAPAPVTTWASLDQWAGAHRLDKPRLLSNSPLATYAIVSRTGAMSLAIGSHEAVWNGINLNLGFEPEMIDGEVYLHSLDLAKNLEPLLCDSPLTFPATNRVIVIDPGHGGMNSGTLSVLDRRPEKEFTLDLARRLAPLLQGEGWKVYLTRTNDTDIALSNRVAFAESHHADCFISLHFNSAAPDKKENGLETYCLTPMGMPSTLTRGFSDEWMERLVNNNFDAQNLQLAVRVHSAILRATGEEDRGIRRARFIGVLRGEKRPAILVEGGFLSNPHEAARIETPEFRQKLAEAVAGALR
jgi:N-acetylmuramoyl-L-alanine amidase